ncbi:MAG TPA: hypothetical protein VFO76_12520, partial [Candidatus Kapabacteria bacterium]|nr:hypothetical protein [Candidatus Kapabacteria bacterium]
MTAEERILAYLDGSLSESESAELLHQLSVSPEKRVVLEQHLKLAELNRLAQKPFEVPAELEEKMRRRLPVVIPSSNAAPVAIRRGAIASLLLLLRSYPTRFAIGALVVLISGAGAYLLSNNHSGNTDASSTAIISQNINNTAPSPRGTTAPVESKSATTTTTNTNETASEPATRNSARSATGITQNTSSSSTSISNTSSISSKLLTNHSSTASHRSLKSAKIVTPIVVDRSNTTRVGQSTTDHVNSNNVANLNASTTDAPQTSSIGVVETASVQSQPIAAISQGDIRER